MIRILLAAALTLISAPTMARPDSRAAQSSTTQGSGDDELGHDDENDAPPPARTRSGDADGERGARASRATSDEGGGAAESGSSRSSREDPEALGPPPTRSLALDLGGAVVTLGGWAYPRIPFKGSTEGALEVFPADGAGGAFKLHYDFVAMDLDWRVGVNGALPSYLGAGATVGIRKDVGPWENPRIIARGGGGLELMVAREEQDGEDAVFLVPVFVAEGETALELTVVPDRFTLGAVFALGLRYGLPLGVGFDIGGYLRANLLF